MGSPVSPEMGENLFQLYISLKELYQLGSASLDRWAMLAYGWAASGHPQAEPQLSAGMESWPWMVFTTGSSQPSLPGCRRHTAWHWSEYSVLCRWTRWGQEPGAQQKLVTQLWTSSPPPLHASCQTLFADILG